MKERGFVNISISLHFPGGKQTGLYNNDSGLAEAGPC